MVRCAAIGCTTLVISIQTRCCMRSPSSSSKRLQARVCWEKALSEAIHNTMAAPSSQDFMARLRPHARRSRRRARTNTRRVTPTECSATPLRTPVKTPLRTDEEEAIFNELMDADHGPHWTSPAKSDEELFVEIAKENGSSVASDEEAPPPVYEAARPPPAPPPSAARPPPSTPPHLAEALAPYAALAKGSPEDVRQRLRAATTTLRRRLDAGLPLRTLVWDRLHERYAVATLVLFRVRN